MKKFSLIIVFTVCLILNLCIPVYANNNTQTQSYNQNSQEVFQIPTELAEIISANSSVHLKRNTFTKGSTVSITAEQVMQYNIDLTEDPEQKRESQQNLRAGTYMVEYDSVYGIFTITTGDIEIHIDDDADSPLSARAAVFSRTKDVKQEKSVLAGSNQVKFRLSGSYKYGYNGQLLYLQSNGAPKIENLTPNTSTIVTLGLASVSGGGSSPTGPLPVLKFSANPKYRYDGNTLTAPMSITVYYENS